jgi:ribonuclease P protein subunit POP4
MPITPATVARHELIGLQAEVVDDPDERTGIAGRIVDETTNTLVIGDGRARTVPKQGVTFALTLPDGERVIVDGDRLVARPARRTETAGDSIWQSD